LPRTRRAYYNRIHGGQNMKLYQEIRWWFRMAGLALAILIAGCEPETGAHFADAGAVAVDARPAQSLDSDRGEACAPACVLAAIPVCCLCPGVDGGSPPGCCAAVAPAGKYTALCCGVPC
jgi:hypothetical protein